MAAAWWDKVRAVFGGRPKAKPTTTLDRVKAAAKAKANANAAKAAGTIGVQPVGPPGDVLPEYKRWAAANDVAVVAADDEYREWLRLRADEPDWESVVSSNISAIRYFFRRMQVQVSFKNGSIYSYYSVPARVFEAFREAGSKGRFLKTSIEQIYRYHEDTGFARRYRKWPHLYS